MPLFAYDRPGPGIAPDAPRKTGLARIWELLARDFWKFWMAGLLNLLLLTPFALGLGLAVVTHSLLLALLVGVAGGMLAAPGFYGLADTLLRSLRDEPGFWWYRYRRVLRQNWKATLLPGALGGTVFSLQLFTLLHLPALEAGLGLLLCQLLAMAVATALTVWSLAQQALLELPFAAILKNSVLLSLRHPLKTLWASAIFVGFLLAAVLFFPGSVFLLTVVGLWLPLLCMLQILYPLLDRAFGIESGPAQ